MYRCCWVLQFSGNLQVGGAGSPSLVAGDFHKKTPINSAAFACVMLRFPAGIADYTRLSARMLPVVRVGIVGKFFRSLLYGC